MTLSFGKSLRTDVVTCALITFMSTAMMSGCASANPISPNSETKLRIRAFTPPAPIITTTSEQNNAILVMLSAQLPNLTIYYTLDGSVPTTGSTVYIAPFLVTSNVTVKSISVNGNAAISTVSTRNFKIQIPSGTLVWSEEFNNSTSSIQPANPSLWNYDTNSFSSEPYTTYCDWESSLSPCLSSNPNTFVGTDGYLHLLALNPSEETYTTGRIDSYGFFSFQYGRLETRAKLPEGQGIWPAIWLLANNAYLPDVSASAYSEMDMVERINAAKTPDWIQGSIHGNYFDEAHEGISTIYQFPSGQSAADWHTYGMIWSPGSIAYYVDSPTNVYVTYTPASLDGISGAVWPFDLPQESFILIFLQVGGAWPGEPDSTTKFPAEMQVDYVRLYTN